MRAKSVADDTYPTFLNDLSMAATRSEKYTIVGKIATWFTE